MSLVPAPVASGQPMVEDNKTVGALIKLLSPFVTDGSTFIKFNLTDEEFLMIAQDPDLARPREEEYNEFHATFGKVGNIETYSFGTDFMTLLLSEEVVTCNNKTFKANVLFAKQVHMDLSKIQLEERFTDNKLVVNSCGGRGKKHPDQLLRTRKLKTLATAISHAIFGSEIKIQTLEEAFLDPRHEENNGKAYALAIFLLLAHNPDAFTLLELIQAKIWTFKPLQKILKKEKVYSDALLQTALGKQDIPKWQRILQRIADAHQSALVQVYKKLFPNNPPRQQWSNHRDYYMG